MPRHFPDWLKAYCQFTRASEAPNAFHFWTGVSTVAGALRRRVWRDEYVFQWTPNFYIILVAPPGIATKSTSLNLGMNLLRQVDGIKFGPDSMTWQALGKDFADATEYVKYHDPILNAETQTAMSPLTVSVSELGTFLRPDDSGLVSFLTHLWDGVRAPFKHHTKSSGNIEVDNPWLNIIGATTPAWLRANFPESMIGEGLTSRVVFVYAEAKRNFVAYPSQVVRGQDHYDTQKQLVEDLREIAAMSGPYEMTRDALAWGEKWYRNHHQDRPVHMASDRYGGYIARKQAHLHKLAIVLAAAQSSKLVLEQHHLEAAELILNETEHSMIKVFESIGVVDEAKHVAEVVQFIRSYKWIEPNQLWRCCMNIMAERDFKQALRVACEGGLVTVKLGPDGKRGLSPIGH